MGKLLKINRCADCRHMHTYKTVKNVLRPICEKACMDIANIETIPDWCPLPDKKECLLYIDPEKSCQALKDHRYEAETGKQPISMGQNLRRLAARVEAE